MKGRTGSRTDDDKEDGIHALMEHGYAVGG